MADELDRYSGVNAKQAMLEASNARNLARTALLISVIAIIVAVTALVFR